MTVRKAGAGALILGAFAMVGVMAVHPTGHGAQTSAHLMLIGKVVHGVAIALVPVLVFGFYAFTRRIGFERPLAVLAFITYALGGITVMIAATMSGLVAPMLIEGRRSGEFSADMAHGLAHLEWYMNQSFATLHVALFSGAFVLWAIAWPGKGLMSGVFRILGLIVGAGVFAWLVSGTLVLNVHGMGAVVLAQSLWTLLAAIALLRSTDRQS